MLILQITTSLASSQSSPNPASFSITITDRFYRTLYASLTDPRLSTSNKQAMYLNLLFKALKADKNIERVKAFVRRFVQVLVAGVGGGGGGTEFVAGGLFLLGEVGSLASIALTPILMSSAALQQYLIVEKSSADVGHPSQQGRRRIRPAKARSTIRTCLRIADVRIGMSSVLDTSLSSLRS